MILDYGRVLESRFSLQHSELKNEVCENTDASVEYCCENNAVS